MGIWPGHRGYTLLFTRSAMGFLMTTESQDLGLTSHPKDKSVRSRQCPEYPVLSNITQVQPCTQFTFFLSGIYH